MRISRLNSLHVLITVVACYGIIVVFSSNKLYGLSPLDYPRTKPLSVGTGPVPLSVGTGRVPLPSFSSHHAHGGPNLKCAPWIPREKRRVLLASTKYTTWEAYQAGTGYLGGEGYWTASLSFVLRSLDFEVVQAEAYDDKSYFYRFILREGTMQGPKPRDMCRARQLGWWLNEVNYSHVLGPFDKVHIPFFVHSELLGLPTELKHVVSTNHTEEQQQQQRHHAFLLIRRCQQLEPILIRKLYDELGLKMHTICRFGSVPREIQDIVKLHKPTSGRRILPQAYIQLLRKCSMIVSFNQTQILSPTAYEAMANGVAFVNARVPHWENDGSDDDGPFAEQAHEAVSNMHLPYSFDYDYVLDNVEATADNLLHAAKLALENPFVSYIPAINKFESVRALVCSRLIEDDSLCNCQNNTDTLLPMDGRPPPSCKKLILP